MTQQLISLHTKVKLFVTTVGAEGRFFVQLDTPEAYTLPSLSEQLSQLVINNPGKTRGFTPSPGTKCCAQSIADNNWYRALVINVNSSLYSVYFVDYGNTETNVPISRLFPAISKYFELPYQAVQCQLANFIPNGGVWNSDMVKVLSENICNQEVPGLFYGELPTDASELSQYDVPCYLVTLYWEESDDTYTVSDELVALGMGSYPNETPEEIMSVPKSKPQPHNDVLIMTSLEAPNDYTYLTLEVGQEYKLYVSFSESPDVVWGQLSDRNAEFESLVSKLQEYIACNGSTLMVDDNSLVAPLSPGQPCCVLYSGDGNWCRCCIEEVDNETLDTRVLFVDFGNTELVTVSDLYSLPSRFFNTSAQAVSFSLHGISPVNDGWSTEAITKFEEFYDGQELVASVVCLDDDGYPSVRLFNPIQGTYIDQVLIQEGHAIAIGNQATPTQAPPTNKGLNENTSNKDPIISKDTTTTNVTNNSNTIMTSYKNIISSTSSKIQKPRMDTYTETIVPLGQNMIVFVTVVDSLDKFYCQLKDHSNELDKLTTLISQHCNSDEVTPIEVALPDLPVLAKFSQDNNWYRGRIFPPKEGSIQWGVVFVDFGNSELININSLMALPEPFLRLPIQSFECSLKGVNPSLMDNQDAIDSFSELVLDQELNCTTISISKKENRDVYTVQLSINGIDIATTLNNTTNQRTSKDQTPTDDTSINKSDSSKTSAWQQAQSSPKKTLIESTQHAVKASTPPRSLEPSSMSFAKIVQSPGKPKGSSANDTSTSTSTIPSLLLPAKCTKQQISVVICYVESPLKFSCQLNDNSSAIQYLVSQMSLYYADAPPTLVKPVTGACCAALFDQDSQWYRAVINNVIDNNQVSVLFVDYGNTEVISIQNTRELTSEFLSLPNQAITCKLDKFPPSLLTDEMSIQFETMTLDRTFQAIFRYSDAKINSPPIQCRLYDQETGQLVINQLIPNLSDFPPLGSSKDSSVKSSKEPSPYTGSQERNTSDRRSRSKEKFAKGERGRGSYNDRSSSGSQREVSRESGRGQTSDERRLRNENFQKDSKVLSRDSSKGRSSRESSRSFSRTDTIETFTPLLKSPLTGWVSHIVSPCEFYVQPSVMSEKLELLMSNLLSFYGQEKKGELNPAPVINTYCCVLLDEESYYRCLIKEVLSNEEISVYSIDYGSMHTVHIKDVYLLNSKFYSFPAQAICCKLAEFKSTDLTEELTERMINNILEQEVELTFVGSHQDNIYEVEVTLIVRQNLRDLLNKTNLTSDPNNDLPSKSDNNVITSSIQQAPPTSETTPSITLLQIGRDTEGVISAISPNGTIYIHLSDSQEQLDEILASIATFMTNPLPQVIGSSLSLNKGSYMLGQFTVDNNWYRALILDLIGEQVHVFYIDFGNQEVLPLTRLHPISPKLLSYPRQAIECKLEELQDHVPSTGAIEVMENELSEAPCVVKASSSTCENGCHIVSMILTSDNSSVSQWMLDTGLFIPATTITNELPANNVPTDNSPNIPADNTSNQVNSQAFDKLIDKSTQSSTQEKEGSILHKYPINKGDNISVYLSHQEDDKTVWVTPTVHSAQLETMTQLLDESYATVDPSLIISDPQPGQTCCAKCTSDGHWYRAVITGLPWSNNISVLYVDYGNQETVGTVYTLKPEFTSLPVLAIKCHLSSSVVESQWEGAVTFHFLGEDVPSPLWHVCVNRNTSTAEIPIPPPPASLINKLPPLQLKLGEKYEVYISHTESPNLFYCQLLSDSVHLEELMAQIADYYTDKVIHIEPVVGTYCVALYSINNTWYRASIIQVISQDEVEVHFIDYGNKEIVSRSMIQGLHDSFTRLPIQAFPCSLLSSTSGHFSEDQLEAFFSLNFDEESFQVLLKSQLSGGEWFVELFDKNGETPHELFVSPSVSPQVISFSTSSSSTVTAYPVPKYRHGASVDVFVTCVNNPDDFYCQPLELASQLEELMTDITSFMSSCTPPSLTTVEIGQPCLARYTNDSDWYRGQIDTLHKDSEKVVVRYVDYGNLALLNLEKICPLPEQFLSIPTQALRCSVLMPIDGETSPLISTSLSEKFICTFTEKQQYTLKIVSNTGSKYFVEVSNGRGPLNFLFLYDTEEESFSSKKESDIGESPLHSSSLVPKNSKSPTTDLEESEEDSTTTGEPLIHAPCKLSLLANETLLVKVVHVKDPSLLYIQRVDCQAELDSLASEIGQYCTDCAGQLYQHSYQPGDFVLAQHTTDLLWYRALVMDLVSEGSFKVQFIDCGNVEIVSSKNMMMCPANFLELPVQAIPCSLSQVPSREGWPDSYTTLINELTQDKVLQANVVLAGKLNIPAAVTLQDLENGIDINEKVHESLDEECEAGSAPDSKIGKENQVYDKEGEENGEVNDKKEEENVEEKEEEKEESVDEKEESVDEKEENVEKEEENGEGLLNNTNTNNANDSLNTRIEYLREKLEKVCVGESINETTIGSTLMEDDSLLDESSLTEGGASLVERGEVSTLASILAQGNSVLQGQDMTINESTVSDGQQCNLEEKVSNIDLNSDVKDEEVTNKEVTVNENGALNGDIIDKETSEGDTISENDNEPPTTSDLLPNTNEETKEEFSKEVSIDKPTEVLIKDDSVETIISTDTKDEEIGEETITSDNNKIDDGVILNVSTGSGDSSTVLEPNDSDSVTDSSLVAIDSLPQFTPKLQVGSQYKVLVVHTNSLYDFVCHLTSYSQVLNAMMSLLAQTYENSESTYTLARPPVIGEIVCAQYTNDGSYYRAIVLKEEEDNAYLVEYFDYGNQEVLPVNRLFSLNQELSVNVYPSFALNCSLHGLPEELPQGDEYIEDTLINAMYDMIEEGKAVDMEVIECVDKSHYKVKLSNENECINDRINDLITTQHNHTSGLVNGDDLTISIKLDQVQTNNNNTQPEL